MDNFSNSAGCYNGAYPSSDQLWQEWFSIQFGYLHLNGDRGEQTATNMLHTYRLYQAPTQRWSTNVRHCCVFLLWVQQPSSDTASHVGFLFVCRVLCNCRIEKPHSNCCGIILSVLHPTHHPKYYYSSTLNKYLRCAYIDLRSFFLLF